MESESGEGGRGAGWRVRVGRGEGVAQCTVNTFVLYVGVFKVVFSDFCCDKLMLVCASLHSQLA